MQNYLRKYFSIAFLLCGVITFGQSSDSLEIITLVRQSDSLRRQMNFEKSRDVAEQILKTDSTFCFAYILLGVTYARYAYECSNQKSTLEGHMIYCLAIDMFRKSKQIDNKCTEQANKFIETYSQYLLSDLEIFTGVNEGEEVMIEGWINRKTIFRYKD
ncbi:hypothetical protein KDU71_22710 [Carboxylicivirga sediminis]|uniref:Uncharacterized protein n=1 Tax=Carboxylicivirga sediminis TaxID=2006564 RepID=A0A941FD11_9BACT|nr:hypothetical protein [Carboxylicivirga sediminis]MBR8538399.1 hypothetical protein [Carboxylicivirga sediminis]